MGNYKKDVRRAAASAKAAPFSSIRQDNVIFYAGIVPVALGALGRYSAGFTLNTYTHATAQMKQDAADAIGAVISQAM